MWQMTQVLAEDDFVTKVLGYKELVDMLSC
jgi:hypothetical protein